MWPFLPLLLIRLRRHADRLQRDRRRKERSRAEAAPGPAHLPPDLEAIKVSVFIPTRSGLTMRVCVRVCHSPPAGKHDGRAVPMHALPHSVCLRARVFLRIWMFCNIRAGWCLSCMLMPYCWDFIHVRDSGLDVHVLKRSYVWVRVYMSLCHCAFVYPHPLPRCLNSRAYAECVRSDDWCVYRSGPKHTDMQNLSCPMELGHLGPL